ncbi:ankyrin, putative [Plasmodium gallinaceum]|uniref:Ankyrin, putative n=1 Tax=Plasmodium gallinaceum TaxID=5849 RepID=A0A1J1GXK2_PLAGA|nr:ankyrin, putative [Plasmodium gallinaceum]CRG95744.1 ankyrin, putative [Plasmodium gallinaceum]
MFKKKILSLNKKEKKDIYFHKLKRIYIQLKIIRYFIYVHNDKIKHIFIKLLYKKIFQCKSLYDINLNVLSLFLKKCRNKVNYNPIKGKSDFKNLQLELFSILNVKTQLNNYITFLINKIINHFVEKGNNKNYILKNCDTKKNKNLLLELIKILLYNYQQREKEKKERKKKEKEKEKNTQIMNNKNDYILIDYCKKENENNLYKKSLNSNNLNKKKGNSLTFTNEQSNIKNENKKQFVEKTSACINSNKLYNIKEKNKVGCNLESMDSSFFYDYMKHYFFSSINEKKKKKIKKKKNIERCNKTKFNSNIYDNSYAFTNLNNKIISNYFLKNQVHRENKSVVYNKTRENYINSCKKKRTKRSNESNVIKNRKNKIVYNEMFYKKLYKIFNKNKKKCIKNLICENHINLYNLNCCTCKFIYSINKVYYSFKHVNFKKQQNNKCLFNENKMNRHYYINPIKWENEYLYKEYDKLKLEKCKKKRKKKKERTTNKLTKIKKEKIVSNYVDKKEKKQGILKEQKKKEKIQNKRVRINICTDKNKKKCSLKKYDNNKRNTSDEHETVEAYLINFCRNNNNIIEVNQNINENNDMNYSELDVYMDEYRGNMENLSMIDDISDLQPIHLATKEGNIELIKKILKSGSDVNSKTRIRKFTPLHLSASKGDIESVKFLIDNSADINALSSDNETPLWCASISNHLNICKYLLANGALLNLNLDEKYDSPLHAASMMGNFEIVKLLIENGADITCLDLNLLEPVHYASFEGHKGIVKYLICQQIKQSLNKKMKEIVSIMKKYNSYTKNLEIHYYLKFKSIFKKRITSKILCCAITSGNYKIVDIILKKGADPNYFDVRLQLFPIHAASITGNIKIFKNLVKRGANIFMKTSCNNLPIDLTEDNDIKQFILQHSRKINVRNAWIIRLKRKNHIISLLSYDIFYYLCTFF